MVSLHAFSGLDGHYLGRVSDFASLSWSDSINEPGSLTATLPDSADIKSLYPAYKTIFAAIDGRDVKHAGYVTHLRKSETSHQWTVDVGGGMTVLHKRLVLDSALIAGWVDGSVVVDEDNPADVWQLSLKGSYSDIVRGLLLETMKFGQLPFTVAPLTGGSHERNYNSYDLAEVYERIADITQLEDGPEVRFDPVLGERWNLSFVQRTATEIIDNRWQWNALVPDSGIVMDDEDLSGDDMCTDCYITGGREEDKLLVARASSSNLTKQGWPVLQTANRTHTSVSILGTLKSYAAAQVAAGDETQDTFGIKAASDLPVKVGDWADIRVRDGVLKLKITDVSGGAGQMQKLQARRRPT